MTGEAVEIPDLTSRRAWAGRLVFFALGAAAPAYVGKIADHLPGPDEVVELAIEAGIVVSLIALRVFHGAFWRWFAYLAGVLFAWTALGLLVLGLVFLEGGRSAPFDGAAWKSAKLGQSESRVWMVDDLLKRPLVGMKVAEVDALLGQDDSVRGTGWGRGYWDDRDRVWWLGPERGLYRIDSEWLVLRVSADGVVTEARLVRD